MPGNGPKSNSGWTISANEETVAVPAQTITDVTQVQMFVSAVATVLSRVAVLNTVSIESGPSTDPAEEVPQALADTTSEVAGQQNPPVEKLDLSPAQQAPSI
jgi:hypothetical protein